MTRARRAAWLGAYAIATALSFPHPVGDRVLDLGFALAWLGPALLVLGLSGLAPRAAARHAFVAGLVGHSLILHWIYVVTVRYGHAAPVVGVLAPVALAAYIAAFVAAFGAGWRWLARRGAANPFSAALLWTALEHLRSFALSGFPWATLGYAQHENPALLALAPFTGVYGLSFVTVLGGTALAELLARARGGARASRAARTALASVVALHALGLVLRAIEPDRPAETVRMAALQGNVDQGQKWDLVRLRETLELYEDLAAQAADRGARVIVLPETALPVALDRYTELKQRWAAFARSRGVAVVIGAVGVEGSNEDLRFYDSAFVLGPDGRFAARYDKAHLVPFGEYVPLRGLLGSLLAAVARGIAPDSVTPGPGPRAIELEGAGLALRAGVPICYELLFPDLIRRFVDGGASVLLAITNDAWYGRTGAPYQFLAMTALRSAETRVFTVRAANTGVSAIIDARGRVVERTRIFERDLVLADVPLRSPPLGGSFYTRHGDVFAWSCWAGFLAISGVAWLRSRSKRER
ncbi:MAG: apolipoprotein N-acyltransferase [Deltaproteobacteria bacterium]|nr:MAG: apolipoprotein N-acyltransferase [Deltaproteobacteria bacterium]